MSKTFNSWEDLSAHLMTMSSLHVQGTEADGDRHAAIRFGLPYEDQVMAAMFIHNPQDETGPWVMAAIRIKPAERFDLEALMEEIPRGPVGALSIAGDYLCATHNLPLRGLTSDHIDWTLAELCAVAKLCIERAKPRPKDGAAFSYLAE